MAKDTHVTAPTRFVEANGIRYAYRRFYADTARGRDVIAGEEPRHYPKPDLT